MAADDEKFAVGCIQAWLASGECFVGPRLFSVLEAFNPLHFSLLTDTTACKLTLASLGELNDVPLGEDD